MATQFMLPDATVGEPYSHAIDLDGDFNLTGFVVPEGLTVSRVGKSFIVHGTPVNDTIDFDVRVGIKQCCCDGQQQSFKSSITVNV